MIPLFQKHYKTWEEVGTREIPLGEQIFTSLGFIIGIIIAAIYFLSKAKTKGEEKFTFWVAGIIIFVIIIGLFS